MKAPLQLGPKHWRDLGAPAKINTFLHVVGRREDGMHLLQSVFMLLDWGDYLDIEVTPNTARITRIDRTSHATTNGQALPVNDLCVQAATLLQRSCGVQLGARIGLHKHLPTQAGLGGGSSDAATCLIVLNKLWGTGLSTAQLCALAVQLGADVPFFVQGHNAFVQGIGERISPITLPATNVWLVKPQAGASTPAIFQSSQLSRNTTTVDLRVLTKLAATDLWAFGHNDLQAVAEQLCPDIKGACNWLKAKGLSPRMTGSGSTVFAHFSPNDNQGQTLQTTQAADLPPNWLSHKCKNLEKHPLHDWNYPKNVR